MSLWSIIESSKVIKTSIKKYLCHSHHQYWAGLPLLSRIIDEIGQNKYHKNYHSTDYLFFLSRYGGIADDLVQKFPCAYYTIQHKSCFVVVGSIVRQGNGASASGMLVITSIWMFLCAMVALTLFPPSPTKECFTMHFAIAAMINGTIGEHNDDICALHLIALPLCPIYNSGLLGQVHHVRQTHVLLTSATAA